VSRESASPLKLLPIPTTPNSAITSSMASEAPA
jgi:hypothetical protein